MSRSKSKRRLAVRDEDEDDDDEDDVLSMSDRKKMRESFDEPGRKDSSRHQMKPSKQNQQTFNSTGWYSRQTKVLKNLV